MMNLQAQTKMDMSQYADDLATLPPKMENTV
jgi:hypothetical protein